MSRARKQSSRKLAAPKRSRLSPGSERGGHAAKAPAVPLNNCNFRVLIGKQELGVCQISRLESGRARVRAQEESPAVLAITEETVPLRVLVLKRALTQSKALYQWWANGDRGRRYLRDVTIQQLDRDGASVVNAWMLHECVPCRWTGPEFNALGDGIAYEEIVFTYARLDWW